MSTARTVNDTRDLVVELDLDELRVVQEMAPPTALPPRLRVPAFGPDDEATARRQAALARLVARDLLVPEASEGSGAVAVDPAAAARGDVRLGPSPDLRALLDVGASSAVAVHTQSWVPAHGSHAIFLPSGLAVSELRLDVARHADPADRDAGRAVLALRPVSRMVARIEALLDGGPAEHERGLASVSLPMIEMQTLIDAVRTGDPRTLEAAAEQLHASHAVDLARALAGPLPCGLRVRAVDRTGRTTHHADWTQTGDGSWVASTGRLPGSASTPPTADDVVANGRITVTRTSRTLMTAELLAAVASLVETDDGSGR